MTSRNEIVEILTDRLCAMTASEAVEYLSDVRAVVSGQHDADLDAKVMVLIQRYGYREVYSALTRLYGLPRMPND